MSVSQLARTIGWEVEYVRWFKRFSGWVHGDAFATQNASLLESPDNYMMLCYHYLARILLRVADAKRIILTGDQVGSLRELSKDFC